MGWQPMPRNFMPELRHYSQSAPRIPSAVLVVAMGLALTIFAWRALLHSPRLYDFRTGYAASRAWVFGSDPYDGVNLDNVWNAAGGFELIATAAVGLYPSYYPPTTFVALSPFSSLPALAACTAWAIVSLALLATMIVQLGRLAGLPPRQHVLLAAIILALGPVISGANAGQQCVVAISCIIIALRQLQVRRFWLAWPLLVYAMCLKPQLAMPFVAWEFFRFPRSAMCAFAVWALVLFGAVQHLDHAGSPWRATLATNYHLANEPGGGLDFSTSYLYRDHLVNTEVVAFPIVKDILAAHVVALIVVGVFVVCVLTRWRSLGFAWRRERNRPPRKIDELLGLSVVAAIALLPMYHRYYDAILLVLPIAWAIRHWRDGGKIILLLTIPLFLPVAWATNLVEKGYVSSAIKNSPVWDFVIMPFFGWLLLVWCVVLAGKWMRQRGSEAANRK